LRGSRLRSRGPARAVTAGSATIAPATSTENHLLRMQKPSMKKEHGTKNKTPQPTRDHSRARGGLRNQRGGIRRHARWCKRKNGG
jgi:hypothetical protein